MQDALGLLSGWFCFAPSCSSSPQQSRTCLGMGCNAQRVLCQQKQRPVPPALPSPLPCTLCLQDEAALGHSCPAGDNAGVEPGIRELCLGDPNPSGDGGETSAPGDPLVTLSHFRVQQYPHAELDTSPKACV